ncbi:MAG: hypothetical protein DI626_05710 [Micavibrio aeruginosavorus]|uniref:Uncharacterized protein n=1 Tax=Micavibrio aeruginosavorus TaxID=349221 RepID=A0A2W5BUD1_9BACT|nr:MAG: hypothetical protein DI626_05710 [Micavibrio aeruginosavorus]
MSIDISVKTHPQFPATRFFILSGIDPITTPLTFSPGNVPARHEARDSEVEKAKDARFPMGAVLLKMPFFSQISIRNLKAGVSIDLTLVDGRRWDEPMQKRTLESYIEDRLKDGVQSVALIGIKDLTQEFRLAKFREDLDKYVSDHPVQKKVKDDGGAMYYKDFDAKTGHVHIAFAEACASGCSLAEVTQNVIRRDLTLKYPDVRDVDFVMVRP